MFPNIDELKRLRLKSGMSQQDLAERVKVSQSAITKYENGVQIPSYTIACKIFDILLEQEIEDEPQLVDIMVRNIIFVPPDEILENVLDIMREYSISQVPIIKNSKIYGTINESKLIDLMDQYHTLSQFKEESVSEIMDEPLPLIPGSSKISFVSDLLKVYGAVLVSISGEISGIVTKADLIRL